MYGPKSACVVELWSDGAARFLGYEAAEVAGRPAGDLLASRLSEAARRCLGRRG